MLYLVKFQNVNNDIKEISEEIMLDNPINIGDNIMFSDNMFLVKQIIHQEFKQSIVIATREYHESKLKFLQKE